MIDVEHFLATVGVSVTMGVGIIVYFLKRRDEKLDTVEKQLNQHLIEDAGHHAKTAAGIAELLRRADKHSGGPPSFTNERD